MLLSMSRYYLHLQLVSRFVDRDMFMRYLGYGIGHKGHTSLAASSDEAADDQEADDSDTESTASIAHNQPLQPMLDACMAADGNGVEEFIDNDHVEVAGDDAHVEEVVDDPQDGDDDAQDGDDDVHSRYSDTDSDNDPDDEDDLDGHL